MTGGLRRIAASIRARHRVAVRPRRESLTRPGSFRPLPSGAPAVHPR